jgi:hypothetical protein
MLNLTVFTWIEVHTYTLLLYYLIIIKLPWMCCIHAATNVFICLHISMKGKGSST